MPCLLSWALCNAVDSRVTLDTPANRKGMPNADFSQWTSVEELAGQLVSWSAGEKRPPSSTLLQVVTVDGVTSYTPV